MFKKTLPVFLIAIALLSLPSFAEEKKSNVPPQAANTTAQTAVSKEQPKAQVQPQTTPQSAPQEEVVKGVIKEIANDGSYVIVNDTKILTTKEFLEDSYLEVGDNVEITAEKTDQGLKAKSYNYIFEEEGSTATPDEPSNDSTEESPQGY